MGAGDEKRGILFESGFGFCTDLSLIKTIKKIYFSIGNSINGKNKR